MRINSVVKVVLLNASLLGAFCLIVASCFELITRSSNPFSLFPSELTIRNTVTVDDKNVSFADARSSVSYSESKTNTLYAHNALGVRAQSDIDKFSFVNDSSDFPTILSVGDSTNYGLNINIDQTFSYKYSQNLNQSLINASYPGVNLNALYYKLSCALTLHKKRIFPFSEVVISLYYNDIESLDILPLDPSSCNQIADLNMSYYFSNKLNYKDISYAPLRRSFLTKLFDVNAYPSRLNRLICGNIYPMTCKYVMFSISNISPNFRNIIFGSTRQDYTDYNNISDNLRVNEWQSKFQNILSILSGFTRVTILYVPRNELDLGIIDTKRESMVGFFRTLCSSNDNLRCIDGANLIVKSLTSDQLSQFKTTKRLPDHYYSYLPMFDLGHPSVFVSNLYAKSLSSHP